MATYEIRTCSWTDMDDLQSLAANALRNSPLTNTILTDPATNRTNTVHTRHTLAHFIYLQALLAQEAPAPTSKVLKAVNTTKPTPEVQACAWLQWFPPSPEPGTHASTQNDDDEINMPWEINPTTWRMIENVRHSHRKSLMNGSGHYFLHTLDFPPNPEGRNAAREILSRIQPMDPHHPILVFSKTEHGDLYQELGWRDVGSVVFKGVAALGEGGWFFLRAFVRDGSDIIP